MDLKSISIYSSLLPILAFCLFSFNWKKLLKIIIFILCLISIIADVACNYLGNKSIPTLWIINVFTVLEAELLFTFFYILFTKKIFKQVTLALAISFLAIWLFRNLIFGNIHSYDYVSQTVEFIFLFILCLLYFFQKTKITDTILIYSYYEFWIVSALLMYCAGTFFSFLTPLSSQVQKNTDIHLFEVITRLSSIVKSILITVAFCMKNIPKSNNLTNPNSMYYLNDLKD